MKFQLGIALLLFLVAGTLGDQGFDLGEALHDLDPVPTEKPKQPSAGDTGDSGFDLFDALGPEATPAKPKEEPKNDDPVPTEKPKQPSAGDTGDSGFDLFDALGPDTKPKPDKPAVNPPSSGGGGGTFSDSDLVDAAGGIPNPDGGHSSDPGYDPHGGADQPQEAGSGAIAGIISTIGVALAGAAGSYFAYQKKKLCFKLQGGGDPESVKGQHGTQSEPQVLSNLLRTN